MAGYIGAEGIRQAFADAGFELSQRQVRHLVDTRRITVLRIGRRLATTDADVQRDIDRWRAVSGAGDHEAGPR